MFFGRIASLVWLGVAALGGLQIAQARELPDDLIPNCPAYDLKSKNGGSPGSLSINNLDVIRWKREGRNQRHERGRVRGAIADVYSDRNGHEHFSLWISAQEKGGKMIEDTVEIIYNQEFGEMPAPRVGMEVEACGDYITSNAPSPGPGNTTYPASPDGAILHWVHAAPDRSGHHSGYVWIDGVLTGQDVGGAGPRPPRAPKQSKQPKQPRIETREAVLVR